MITHVAIEAGFCPSPTILPGFARRADGAGSACGAARARSTGTARGRRRAGRPDVTLGTSGAGQPVGPLGVPHKLALLAGAHLVGVLVDHPQGSTRLREAASDLAGCLGRNRRPRITGHQGDGAGQNADINDAVEAESGHRPQMED